MAQASRVWQYFDNLGGEAAQCKVCKATVKRKNNTTNLIVHLRKHQVQYDDYCNSKLAAAKNNKGGEDDDDRDATSSNNNNSNAKSTDSNKGRVKQTKLSSYMNPPLSARRQDEITNAMVEWLCEDSVPIYSVEKQGFRKFMSVVEKRYVPSRKSVMVIVTSNYNVKCTQLKAQLKYHVVEPKRFCSITTDLWSASTMEPYMAVTVHYINNEWNLKSKHLQCFYLPGSHTADLLAEEIMNVMVEWGLATSCHIDDTLGASLPHISALTSDNGANIVKACSTLACLRIPCFGHCLNLAVKKGLEDDRIGRALTAVRKVVRHFAHSGQKQQQLAKVQEELGAPKKKLKNDCDTR